jgi:hypothetical protein
VPGYWLVRYDILTAREHLNFSTVGAKPAACRRRAGASHLEAEGEDPHWFGARIPDRPLSVEFVLAGSEEPVYQRFAGPGLTADQGAADAAAERTSFVLGLAPAPLP